MKLLAIRKYPDKILRQKCRMVAKVTGREKELLNSMFLTMKYFDGIGLAGPQAGVAENLVVADVEGKIIKLVNPRILKLSGKDVIREGCLSLPGLSVDVKRPLEAVVEGLNENGQVLEIKAKGLLARVLQHEIDHLSGKMIVDYLPFLRKTKFYFTHGR